MPDYVIVRANGDPLYTLTNPVDDALMEITHVLRGEDLLSSTPRQVVLYSALEELGIAGFTPRFGHLPYVMGEGNKKLSKRDPESNLLLHRKRGMIPEGLLNYLGLLGWSIAPDHDVFSKEEMIAAFDIADVNPNPARFDDKKCVAINADHIRLLEEDDFRDRLVPYLHEAKVVSAAEFSGLTDHEQEILSAAAPLAHTRMQLLGEAGALMGFLFTDSSHIEYNQKAVSKLRDSAPAALAGAKSALSSLSPDQFDATSIKRVLDDSLVEGLGIKPRFAFGPLFVAMTGTNVSLPVVDSMAILGQNEVVERIAKLEAFLAE